MNELEIRAAALGLPVTATLEEVERAEREAGNLQTRAQFVPKSYNAEARTVDVTFATETPVRMFTWEDGAVNEVLSIDASHIRWERINGGAPVLDNHDRSRGTAGVLGVIENARVVNGQAVATLRFSSRPEVAGIIKDVEEGILRGVSVGYRVYKYEITKEEGKLPTYRATDWEPFEISLAPVQADPASHVRNDNKKIIDNKQNNKTMTELEKRALAVGLPQTATEAEVVRAEADAKTRKEKEIKDAAEALVKAEQTRAAEITDAVRLAGLETEVAVRLIKENKTVDAARAEVINLVAEKNAANISGQNRSAATVGTEQRDKVREAMTVAIEHRANPNTPLTEEARAFRGSSLIELAKFQLEQSGVNARGMSPREVAINAFGLGERGYMSSSDFPYILGNAAERTLRKAYAAFPTTFASWTSRGSFSNFKPKEVYQLGETAKMEKVVEGGEYKYGNLSEAKETYSVDKYGKIIPITWEAIINDDLNAFSRIPQSIATQAKLLQNEIVYAILSANANMGDGVALFHATHGNLAGAGAAITTASLQAARTAMRNQKGLDGKTFLNLVPKYLICGPTSELAAYQYTSSQFVPAKNSDINPVYNSQLQVIVDPRITGTEWYLACDPAQNDTIEYSFLEGEGELFTERRVGFDVDGLQIKARMVFGAKAIDFRGLYKNAGA